MNKSTHLWLFKTGVGTGLEITEVAEDALFEFFHINDGATESLKAEDKGADNISPGDMIEARPEDAGDVFAGGEEETIKSWVGCWKSWKLGAILRG
jgi:hypothetical protein